MKNNYDNYNDRNVDIERNLKELGWTRPTDEEFSSWIEMGETKSRHRTRIAKTVGTFALVLGLCTVLGLAGTFEPESATANPDDDIVIESGMETVDTYTSQEELPDEVKEKFLLFPEMPEGYEVTEVVHEKTETIQKLSVLACDGNEVIYIVETDLLNGGMNSNLSAEESYIEMWDEKEVTIKEYPDEKQKVYEFMCEGIFIRIQADIKMRNGNIQECFDVAVRK